MSDPLLTEIDAEIARLDILPGEGAENAFDMASAILDDAEREAGDDYESAVYRKALLECAAYCVAGLREIDGRVK